MASVITSVLNLVLGLLCNKVRDLATNRWKDGDITAQKCGDFIVRELDYIKTKIDGLARKDVLSSVSFLKDGLCFLDDAIKEATDNTDGKEKGDNLEDETSFILQHGAGNHNVNKAWPLELSGAAEKLKNASREKFQSAKDSFKDAHQKATAAFNNEALPIDDRILATKIRVISRILESLTAPNAATKLCKIYLQDLHDLPAVKETFSVYLEGGIQSIFYKTRRLEMVLSVTMINFVLFNYTCMFSKIPLNLFNWPRIEHGQRSFHPMTANSEIMKNVEQFGSQPHNEIIMFDYIYCCSVNSKREIAAWEINGDIKVFNRTTSNWRFLFTISHEMTGTNANRLWEEDINIAIAIDEDDNLYIVIHFRTNDVYRYKLFIFDTNKNLKQFELKFLDGEQFFAKTRLALSKDKNIIIHRSGEAKLWVCNQSGDKLHDFRSEPDVSDLCVSDKNEIIATPRRGRLVYIYTKEGKERKFAVPEGHEVSEVAFNHITETVIVGTWLNNSYFLSSYSKTGEQQDSLEIPRMRQCKNAKLSSHPSGPVALFHDEGVIFIQ